MNDVYRMLLGYARKFLEHRISAEVFSNTYIVLWKVAHKLEVSTSYDGKLGDCVARIFSAADAFEAEDDRLECELDEIQFREEVAQHIEKYEASIK